MNFVGGTGWDMPPSCKGCLYRIHDPLYNSFVNVWKVVGAMGD